MYMYIHKYGCTHFRLEKRDGFGGQEKTPRLRVEPLETAMASQNAGTVGMGKHGSSGTTEILLGDCHFQ